MQYCTGLTDCQLQLCEARNAYHELMITGRTVRILHADGEVEYSKIRAADLKEYIQTLEAQCGGVNGDSIRRSPIRFGGCG